MFKRVLFVSVVALFGATQTAQAISVKEAVQCFETAKLSASNGTTLRSIILKYLEPHNAAARALQMQRAERGWRGLTDSEKTHRSQQVIDFILDSDVFSEIELSSVSVNGNRAKQNKHSVVLPGNFIRNGERENFAFLIVLIQGNCRFIDARWTNAWLSRHVDIDLQ